MFYINNGTIRGGIYALHGAVEINEDQLQFDMLCELMIRLINYCYQKINLKVYCSNIEAHIFAHDYI